MNSPWPLARLQPNMRRSRNWILLLALTGACAGRGDPEAPAYEPSGQAKCFVTASRSRPLIVEWPMAERASLEARLGRGLVVVRADGCEVEVLRDCHIQATYAYVVTTRKRESISIHNMDELYANLPMGAAKLEGKLVKGGHLEVNTVLVGMLEAPAEARDTAPVGRCQNATHYIAAAQLGAFEFFAAASHYVAAGVHVGNAGVGVDSIRAREVLSTDGDPSICADAGGGVPEPQNGCRAVIRIELAELSSTTAEVPQGAERSADTSNRHRPPSWAHGKLVNEQRPSLDVTRLDGTAGDLGSLGRSRLLLFWDNSTREEMAHAINMMNVLQLARDDLSKLGIDVAAVYMPFPARARNGAIPSDLASIAAFREKWRLAGKADIELGVYARSDGYATTLASSPAIIIVDANGIVRWHSDGVHGLSRDEKALVEPYWREKEDQWTINEAITYVKSVAAK